MKMKDPHTGLISGKMGNQIYYVVDGKQYIRRASIPGKKRKTEVEGTHPKHKEIMTRFSMVQSYYTFFRKHVSDTIWKTAGRMEHCRADNLFHRLNSRCFSGDGKLADFATFRFSYGELQLPRNIAIAKEGDMYRVTWEDERNGALAAPEDRLWIGVIYDVKPGAPRLAVAVNGVRNDMEGTFRLDEMYKGIAHIYCFFGREDETAYSESLYFKLP